MLIHLLVAAVPHIFQHAKELQSDRIVSTWHQSAAIH